MVSGREGTSGVDEGKEGVCVGHLTSYKTSFEKLRRKYDEDFCVYK